MRLLIILSLVAGVILSQGIIEDDYVSWCGTILFYEMVDFDTAKSRCANLDVIVDEEDKKNNLAIVNDVKKNELLVKLLGLAAKKKWKDDWPKTNMWAQNKWVWTGLRKTKNVDKSNSYNPLDWEWTDGSNPFDFEEWTKKQPDRKKMKGQGRQYEMRINRHGRWDDGFKSEKHPYACDYRGFYQPHKDKLTWSQAKIVCEKSGMKLAKVRSPDDKDKLMRAAEFFLGPRTEDDKDPSNWIWIDGSVENNTWIYEDGSPVEYFDWFDSNPDNHIPASNVDSQSVLSISKWGKNDDFYASPEEVRPYACQCRRMWYKK